MCRRFFAWRGWRPLGRMSLPALMVHWHFVLLQVAINTQTARVAVYEIVCIYCLYLLLVREILTNLLCPHFDDDGMWASMRRIWGSIPGTIDLGNELSYC